METTNIKNKLEEMKIILVDRTNRIENDKKRKEPIPQDFAEQAVAVENDEVLDALDEVDQEWALTIEKAAKAAGEAA